MANPANSVLQNLLPVQAYFSVDGTFQTFIGQGQPFYATVDPSQSGLNITNSTINSTTIGATTPSTGVFTNITTTTGTIYTTPASDTDIANKAYVDATSQGLAFKQPAKYTTTGDISLSGLATQGGGDWPTALTAGMRILVKNQTATADNGIYVAASGSWARSADANTWDEIVAAYLFITSGTVWAGSSWVDTNTDGGTLGVTPVTFVQFSNNATYTAGTGLTLAGYQFSITPVGTAGTYGSASQVPVFVTNASGQVTSVTNTSIAIAANQITSGTIDTARISGSYTGITGVGTLTAGTWNASTIGVAYGGTGATTLTGYVKGSGTSAFTASATVPTTDLSGTISNAQLANSTISGVSLGSNLFSLTIGSGLTGTSYNGSTAVTITNSSPMTYPAAGIANSTGTAWGTSYSTTGTGTVVALATAPTLNNPTISNYQAFTPTTAPTYAEGLLFYDSSAKTLNYYNDNSEMSLNIGQEQIVRVKNQTGAQINDGSVVYINGATGNTPTIALAIATSFATSDIIGVTTTNIANNGFGYVTTSGLVNGLNTSAFTDGQTVFLSPTVAGTYTATEPSNPNYSVQVGVITRVSPSVGALLVGIQFISTETSHIVGQVPIASGGTNGTATPTAGGIAYGSGTAYAFTAAGSSGQVLTSAGSGTPTWSTPTSYATVTDDTTTNATRYPLFANATSGNLTTEYVSSTKYQFNPSTGVLTATSFSGAGTGLTGTASSLSIGGNAATATSATSATTATNLAGGTANQIPYQTGAGATSFVVAPTTASTALTWSGSAFTWATAGTAVTISDDTTTNATRYPLFANATSGTVSTEYVSSTKYKYNPSTGELTAPEVIASNGILINGTTVSASYTIASGNNGFSVGPITVASGQAVTVSSGQRWLVL